MVRAWVWMGVVSSVMAIGCLKKPPPLPVDDQGDGAAPSATATPSAAPNPAGPSGAANEADVTHYPDQVAGNLEPLTARLTLITRSEASVINGKAISPLKAGTVTQKVADHDGFYLVLYPDPTDGSRQIEGWAPHSALGGPLPHYEGGLPYTHHDGGTAPAVDAGHASTRPLDLKKVGGSCPPGGYAACGAICRLTCRADGDCGVPGAHCVGGFCLGPGASPCSH